MPELVRSTVSGGVATITLDSPGNRNALSRALRAELRHAIDAAVAEPRVRVLVLAHEGPTFSSGMDLKEEATADPGREGVRELPAILQRIARSPKPVVARLAGPARAGGIGLIAAADIVVAVDTATFAFTEVRVGVIPAVISLPVLRRMQPAAARRLLLTGEQFDAADAAQFGLVDFVVPAVDLVSRVAEVCAELLAGGPRALAGTKRLLAAGTEDADDRYAELLELSARQFGSAEAREGAAAFREKRSPVWPLD
jgi:methylglutaconyl-CoA hydratase